MKQPRYVRTAFITLLVILALLPTLQWSTVQALNSMFNAPVYWVPDSLPQRQQYDWFTEKFESNRSIVVSWAGCHVDDQRLAILAQRLTEPDDQQTRDLYGHLFQRVRTGYDAVRDLEAEPLSLSRPAALKRLTGALVGPDGTSSCAIVILTEFGDRHRNEALEIIRREATREASLSRSDLRLAGPIVDGAVIDSETVKSAFRFGIPSTILAFLLCWWCLRSLTATLVLAVAAVFARALVLALVFLTNSQMNAILSAMPALVFALTMAGGVHLVNYFFEEARENGVNASAADAIAKGWLPCVLAALTTAIGLGSLMVSEIVPIHLFGIFSSLGVVVGISLLFLLLPGALVQWPLRAAGPLRADRRREPGQRSRRWIDGLFLAIHGYSTWIVLGLLAVMIALGWGWRHVETSVSVRALFEKNSPSLRDYHWMESQIGPLVPLEVLLHFDADCGLSDIQRVELVHQVQQELDAIQHLDGTISAATFAPAIAIGRHLGARQIRDWTIFLKKSRPKFIEMKYLYGDATGDVWRISARVSALANLDYGLFLQRMKRRIEPVVIDYQRERYVSGVTTTYTGLMPLTYDVQRKLLNDLFRSFLTAFVFVAVVMIVVLLADDLSRSQPSHLLHTAIVLLRAMTAGLIVMIPNLFPAAIVFGTMGWMGVPIDIGSVMTASIALGISIDDSLHFVCWFRRETAAGVSRAGAVRSCLQHCGRAMVQTTIICGLAMLVFVLSPFVPTKRFGWLMFLLLLTALCGDLLLLPALLVGRLGRLLVRMPSSEAPQPQTAAAQLAAAGSTVGTDQVGSSQSSPPRYR